MIDLEGARGINDTWPSKATMYMALSFLEDQPVCMVWWLYQEMYCTMQKNELKKMKKNSGYNESVVDNVLRGFMYNLAAQWYVS